MQLTNEELSLLQKIKDNKEIPVNSDLKRLLKYGFIQVVGDYIDGTKDYAVTKQGKEALNQ
jgi:hypothetical protein